MEEAMYITNKKIVNAIELRDDDSGSYGSYFRITRKVGIKVMKFKKNGGYDLRKALLKSGIYKEAVKEYKMIKEARRRSKMVVKTYGLKTFKYIDQWYVGILLEHISGTSLSEKNSPDKVMDNLMGVMRKVKVFIYDHNTCNFIKQRDKGWRIIDFSPDWVSVEAL